MWAAGDCYGEGPVLDYASEETAFLIPAHRGNFAVSFEWAIWRRSAGRGSGSRMLMRWLTIYERWSGTGRVPAAARRSRCVGIDSRAVYVGSFG